MREEFVHDAIEPLLIEYAAGVLDANAQAQPEHSIFWTSRAQWYVEPSAHPKFDEYAQ